MHNHEHCHDHDNTHENKQEHDCDNKHEHDCDHQNEQDCDSRNDHANDHQHEKDCDHNHNHNQEHSCGYQPARDSDRRHEHDSDHQNEQDCDLRHDHACDHQHDHESNQKHNLHSENGLTPAVCSLTVDAPHTSSSECEETIPQKIRLLRDWAKQKGFLIGHIKAVICTPDDTIWISCTGGEVNIKKAPGKNAASGVTAIIYGLDETELHDKMKQLFTSQ